MTTYARFAACTAAAATAALTLSACAGSAGSGDGAGDEAGFEFGTDQAEVDEVLADLEPVTLNYQPAAAGPDSIMAPGALGYKEYIEERSGGKIEIDIVWGQAIAGYGEVYDALADGRLDLGYALPIYNPSEFPTFDAIANAMAGLPVSPVRGEAVYNAIAADIGWQTQGLLDEYEEQGVVTLSPVVASGGYHSVCNTEGVDGDDWNGRQIRVASTAHLAVTEDLGASPVSMEYVEVYEALQRGTVDCTFAQLLPSAESGLFDVAPHIGYSSDGSSMSSRVVGAELAGLSFSSLPLAYQQILFDASAHTYSGVVGITADGNASAVEQSKAADGTITQFGEDTEAQIRETSERQLESVVENGLVGDDIAERIAASQEKWESVATEVGIEDEGTLEDLDEWWEVGEGDFTEMGERVYAETGLAHRPA